VLGAPRGFLGAEVAQVGDAAGRNSGACACVCVRVCFRVEGVVMKACDIVLGARREDSSRDGSGAGR
jgi:hypothetical protein